jgi:hypothetical protein
MDPLTEGANAGYHHERRICKYDEGTPEEKLWQEGYTYGWSERT